MGTAGAWRFRFTHTDRLSGDGTSGLPVFRLACVRGPNIREIPQTFPGLSTTFDMNDTESISIRMSAAEVAKVDELCGEGVSRSAFVRELLRRAGPLDDEPSYHEALVLLAKSARAGKVQAQVALERALRGDQPASELEDFLRGT